MGKHNGGPSSLIEGDGISDAVLLDRVVDLEAVFERQAQRLFTVDHLAVFGSLRANIKMKVIRNDHIDNIDIRPGNKLTPIGHRFFPAIAFSTLTGKLVIDVTQDLAHRNGRSVWEMHWHGGITEGVSTAHGAGADDTNIQFLHNLRPFYQASSRTLLSSSVMALLSEDYQ